MKKFLAFSFVSILGACSSGSHQDVAVDDNVEQVGQRVPASDDLSGAYLGEGIYNRPGIGDGMSYPAIRFYLKKAKGESFYYGVILEYDMLQNMALPYLSAQKAPALNKVIGYLDKIATKVSVYKVVPTQTANKSFEFYNLVAANGKIKAEDNVSLVMTLGNPQAGEHALAGATITGDKEGHIRFPSKGDKKKFFGGLVDLVTISQYELASLTYKKAKLASTWRGDFDNLQGSYLSEYGKLEDGVLELYTQSQARRAKFTASRTRPSQYTNPKSAGLQGDYFVSEAIENMFVLTPVKATGGRTDKEMTSRIGLFLDIFDASAPEAGGHMVVELAFTNPKDPSDFMMYYQHPDHKKNVGVKNR